MSRRTRLEKAIEQDEFEMHYQPLVDLRTGALMGAEALVRWNNPLSGTLILPSEFIPELERSDLILHPANGF